MEGETGILSNYLKHLGIGDRMSNLLEHRNIFLVLGMDISNMLDALRSIEVTSIRVMIFLRELYCGEYLKSMIFWMKKVSRHELNTESI